MIQIVGLSDLLLSINGYQQPGILPRGSRSRYPPRQMVLRTTACKGYGAAIPAYHLIVRRAPAPPTPTKKSPLFAYPESLLQVPVVGSTIRFNTYQKKHKYL